jgi:hypothetical protein
MLRGVAFDCPETTINAAVEKASRIVLKVLSSEARASFLSDVGDDLASCGVNLGLCQGFSRGCKVTEMATDFFPSGISTPS